MFDAYVDMKKNIVKSAWDINGFIGIPKNWGGAVLNPLSIYAIGFQAKSIGKRQTVKFPKFCKIC